MKRKHLSLFLLFFSLFISAYGRMHDADSKLMPEGGNGDPGLFWKIEKEGMSAPAYLFGTYQLLNDGYLDEWPAVRQAYLNRGEVDVEMVVDSSQLGAAMMVGMMSDQTLSDLLDSADFAMVDEEMRSTTSADYCVTNNKIRVV